MATRSILFYRKDDGELVGKSCHWSGHPTDMLPTLQRLHKAWGNNLEITVANLITNSDWGHWSEIFNWDGAKENIKPFTASFVRESKEAYEQNKPYAFAYTEYWALCKWDHRNDFADYLYILSDAGITVLYALCADEKVGSGDKVGYLLRGFIRWDEDIEQSSYFGYGKEKLDLGYYYE